MRLLKKKRTTTYLCMYNMPNTNINSNIFFQYITCMYSLHILQNTIWSKQCLHDDGAAATRVLILLPIYLVSYVYSIHTTQHQCY